MSTKKTDFYLVTPRALDVQYDSNGNCIYTEEFSGSYQEGAEGDYDVTQYLVGGSPLVTARTLKQVGGELTVNPPAITPWSRPTDWPELDPTAGVIVGLFAVTENDDRLAVYLNGNYNVDWGDGTDDDALGGFNAEHVYDYSELELEPNALGQKIVTVVITSEVTVDNIDLQVVHGDLTDLVSATNWLELCIDAPDCTSLVISGIGAATKFPYLQSVTILNQADSDFSHMFNGLSALKSVSLNTTGVTTFLNTFYNCFSLETVPLFDMSSATDTTFMFFGCNNLKSIPAFDLSSMIVGLGMFQGCSSLSSLPLMDTSSLITADYMFGGCTALREIPQFDFSSVVSASYAFSGCTALRTIPLIDFGFCADMEGMFKDCTALETISLIDTSTVLTTSLMFDGCHSLKVVPLLDIGASADTSYMFDDCRSLMTIPLLDTSSSLDTSSMFNNCISLVSIPAIDLSSSMYCNNLFSGCVSLQSLPDIDVSSCQNFSDMLTGVPLQYSGLFGGTTPIIYFRKPLSAEALDLIFTNLGTADVGSEINISGCIGAGTCDQTIATAKGWTVVNV
jgi:hypothetical protein